MKSPVFSGFCKAGWQIADGVGFTLNDVGTRMQALHGPGGCQQATAAKPSRNRHLVRPLVNCRGRADTRSDERATYLF